MPGRSTVARVLTFNGVPGDVAEYCRRLGRPIVATRGSILAQQGEPARQCFLVRSGYAKVLSTSESGHQVLVGFLGPRDVIGQAAATTWGRTYLATTVATERMELICWTRESALAIAERFPDIQRRLDALLERNLKAVFSRLHTLDEGLVPQRLAGALLELATRHGSADELDVRIKPLVTREDLAALVGTSVYTASRILAEWEKRGLLASRRGRIRLTSLPGLRAIARSSSPRR
jgi:CRP-like cAMP-binding protein